MKKTIVLIIALTSVLAYAQQSNNNLNIEMVFVEGGLFNRGCADTIGLGNGCDEDERFPHRVSLSSYHIGKYQVTQAQWQAVMSNNPSHFKGDNLPVESVTWFEVQEFIQKLNALTGKNYRLPTEAEWEFAARGGVKSQGFEYSGSNTNSEVGWILENSGGRTHPVGEKPGNELGLHDMTGNVREWTNDWYAIDYYAHSPEKNPQGPAFGTARVMKGGSYSSKRKGSRSANRNSNPPDARSVHNGFRLAY
ncbi:MAG: formylglycine-generating enzyme family protein [Prevotellaceae bacterium]|jgi:formylglycine-generating enzyme required for sulfatase activity|nr:formylglycine-generating enzyme family protein [Prevotellaceae bacterium]